MHDDPLNFPGKQVSTHSPFLIHLPTVIQLHVCKQSFPIFPLGQTESKKHYLLKKNVCNYKSIFNIITEDTYFSVINRANVLMNLIFQ